MMIRCVGVGFVRRMQARGAIAVTLSLLLLVGALGACGGAGPDGDTVAQRWDSARWDETRWVE